MAILDINWKPGSKELRQFAGLLLVVVVVFAGFDLYKTGAVDSGRWLWRLCAAGAAFGVAGLIVPVAIRPLYVGWMALAFPIGWTVSHLLLGMLYYFMITPIGLLLRAAGNDPMHREFDRSAKSYWLEHRTGDDPSRCFRQF